jgi:hypothetical protein
LVTSLPYGVSSDIALSVSYLYLTSINQRLVLVCQTPSCLLAIMTNLAIYFRSRSSLFSSVWPDVTNPLMSSD